MLQLPDTEPEGTKKKKRETDSVSHSVVSDSLQPYELWPPGFSVHGILHGEGSHSLLQEIFTTQGSTWVETNGLLMVKPI